MGLYISVKVLILLMGIIMFFLLSEGFVYLSNLKLFILLFCSIGIIVASVMTTKIDVRLKEEAVVEQLDLQEKKSLLSMDKAKDSIFNLESVYDVQTDTGIYQVTFKSWMPQIKSIRKLDKD
ncbi:hypothetical protein [Bacillus thuringiensis]|uniref:hypothetical protein n=1 Tax=Bacillus thuringiensis TaxID=1428 RepID=UPI0011A40833|nr:hypothetical protein [Bacillus thuringiensis]